MVSEPSDSVEPNPEPGDGRDAWSPRRVVGWFATAVALAAGLVIFGLQFSLSMSLGQLALGGLGLQQHLSKAADALTAGNYEEGTREFDEAAASVTQMQGSLEGRAIPAVERIPGLAVAIDNWRLTVSAADSLTSATGELLGLYGDLSGNSGTSKIFQDGAIDLVRLEQVPDRVTQAQADLRSARQDLRAITATTSASQQLDEFRKQALAEMRPVQDAVNALVDIAPVLPDALGADGPRRYLVAIGNQAEMRASFGAPLSLVMIEFDEGRISIPVRGQTSTELFPPLNRPVEWFGPAVNPFFPGNTRERPFVVSNTHPNLMFSAQEMAGAWEAGGYPRVDGIFAIDLTAIAAVLEATGPIDSPTYGQVDGERLSQLLLIDAYQEFGQEEAVLRQQANQELLDDLLTTLLSGEDLITVAQAIASTAPGRHFQMWMRDAGIQSLAINTGVAGVVADPGIGDWAAVYSQNGNQSKVDVFQRRNILKQVFLREDGSAQINQVVIVTNDTPADRPEGPPERIGYETSWVKNAYMIYAPREATRRQITYPGDFAVRSFKGHTRGQLGAGWVDDGSGYPMIRVVGWTPPGGESAITLSYEMPAGSFVAGQLPGDSEATEVDVLEYRVQAEPQALLVDQTLTVQVYPPAGWTIATYPGMKVENGAAIVSAVVEGPTRIGVKAVPSTRVQ